MPTISAWKTQAYFPNYNTHDTNPTYFSVIFDLATVSIVECIMKYGSKLLPDDRTAMRHTHAGLPSRVQQHT